MLRVATSHRNQTTPAYCLDCGDPHHCSHSGKFTPIWVTTKSKSGKYFELSPYSLANSEGHLMENIYQFSKIYQTVPATRERLRFNSSKVIWEHPAETHLDDDGNPTPEYWAWRQKGMENPDPVRYPTGYKHRSKCLGAIEHMGGPLLDYIAGRKRIYVPTYTSLVKEKTQFKRLKKRLQEGEKLLIIDVDGPKAQSLDYYVERYGVAHDWIDRDSIAVTPENLQILLNDPKHPFGHGFCLAAALLDYDLTGNEHPDLDLDEIIE
jgi:hypothetical protein